jgi:hypothetical protein
MSMQPWTDDIDPATIPDEILKTERARRNALKRQSYTGGVYWKQHNRETPRCRCVDCMEARARTKNGAVKLVQPNLPARQRRSRAQKNAPPETPTLLPIQPGEHKTRQGMRAVVVRADELGVAGFVEYNRNGRVYRHKKMWSRETGHQVLGGSRQMPGFDLVARIDPRLTVRTANNGAKTHTALLEEWEWAK